VLVELKVEVGLFFGAARKQRLRGGHIAGLDALRPDDDQRPCSLFDMPGIKNPPDEPREVIAVQMRDENGVDARRIQSRAFHSDQARRAAVDEKVEFPRRHMKARLESSARAECIA